ncbi:Zinc transporter ZupT [bioreactor metagenome]|uniref:Zinc transporter ZupT n=2 Tax=root TaxID=1 RepID=A0A645H5N5_9ZZZZ
MLDLIDKYAPHQHYLFNKKSEGRASNLTKVWLFIIAITIHNFPEGLAVGVGFGGNNINDGISLAIGIALQNMPEGLAVGLALIRENYSAKKAFLIALLTGLVEPVGGVIGVSLVSIAQPILPFILALAAGAMLFVISDEIIPETHEHGYERIATYGLLIGFIIMMIMDVTLG